MPLILKEENKIFGNLSVWLTSEDESFFLKKLRLDKTQLNTISTWVGKRRLEWLTGRHLILSEMGSRPSDITIDSFGKPHLPNTHFHISVSHSKKVVGLAWSTSRIGLDIQMYYPNMSRISHKFCVPEDHEKIGQSYSISQQEHIIWSAKEAVYKAYGRKELDFNKNILIDSTRTADDRLLLEMSVFKESTSLSYLVNTKIFDHMILAIAVHMDSDE